MSAAIDLAQFAKDIGQPDAMAFQRRANQWLGALRGRLGTLSISGAPLDPLDAMRGALNVDVGRTLADLALCRALAARYGQGPLQLPASAQGIAELAPYVPGAPEFEGQDLRARLVQQARSVAWIARRQAQHQLKALRDRPRAKWDDRPALVVTRVPDHLPHTLPIAVELRKTHGLTSVFAVNDAVTRERVEAAGFEAINLYEAAPPNPVGLAAQTARFVARVAAAMPGFAPAGFEPIERAAIRPVTLKVVAQNTTDVLRLAHGVDWFLGKARPALVLAANPYTVDGRVAWRIAAARGVPTASVEHGTVFLNDPIWDECSVDLFCAWGEPSKQTLRANGLKEERIAVTGAAYLDGFIRAFEAGAPNPPSVLVATSGPGDLVSHEQHAAFIEMLYEAAAAAPEVKLVAKLHRKDRAELYAAAASRHPGAQVEVVASTGLGDIFTWLRGARAMITIASAAAMEAMVVQVPVITVQPATSSIRVEFIERGATHHVKTAAGLTKELKAVWRGTKDAKVDAAARAYAAEHFAHLGDASATAASKLAQLALAGRR